MGRKLHYRPGSHYKVDDRTGFPERAENTRKEWNGLIVSEKVFERRQPQDLVRGVRDDQTVPEPRPLPPDIEVGPRYFTLTANAAIGATVLTVDSTFGLVAADRVGVMLNTGVYFRTTIAPAGVGASTVTLNAGLPGAADSGNRAVDYEQNIPAPE